MSGTAVFISPHLDDVVFSCGGTVAKLASRGWRCVLVTCFTRSVADPSGFALACQTDKGVPSGVDYMELRRSEDVESARISGVSRVVHLDHAEAPHRGYESAKSLFGGVYLGDAVFEEVAVDLGFIISSEAPDLLFAPQGLGNHVDHLQVVQAVREVTEKDREGRPNPRISRNPHVFFYRDTPYAIRAGQTHPEPRLPSGLREIPVGLIPDNLETKLRATEAYGSQIGFQFDGPEKARASLTYFAASEAGRIGAESRYAEAFLSTDEGADHIAEVI
ncbi:PIG-L deacetylase family protein [Rubrobacter indicoceani]|uniref:PIG-L deacetylase family protein n=1 Tax=Rubrobacter indicoceani TaxID=2051957 RepID=UPI0013C4A6D1|nr:PIG-L deacetylase family protein [Rubrobacter indicoceani]